MIRPQAAEGAGELLWKGLWAALRLLGAALSNGWLWLAAALAVLLVVVLRERRVFRQLNRMLDDAISGDFETRTYNETRFSQLEHKLWRFLKSSSLTRRQLEADHAQTAQLVSDISHQTKTPIANILLYTQLLQECGLDENARALAGQICGQSEKLQFLIEALVKSSRLETGLIRVRPERQPIAPLLAQLQEDIAPRAGEKRLAMRWEIPEDAVCRCDLKWTQEALFNLLDNAVKYTPDGGTVTVTVTLYELFCRIDVTDTGIGISEEEQARVFERFYRSPRVAQEKGVGIGLYLARRIVAEEGGYMRVQSRGKGATFSVFLPR